MGGSLSEFIETIRITQSQGSGGYQADDERPIGAYQMGVGVLISTGYLIASSTNFRWLDGQEWPGSKQEFENNSTVQDDAIREYWLNT